jgi:hypothetical protein
MIRPRIGILVALGLLAIAPSAQAQINNLPPGFGTNGFDPFSAYYGYFIPRNQSIAAQLAGGATEAVNLNAQARRAVALTNPNRQSLYELDNPYEMIPLEQRSFTRPPTILRHGQYAGPYTGGYFGRSTRFFAGAGSGMPGSVQGSGVPRVPTGGPLSRPIGTFGGAGGVGGFGGFGGFGGYR